MFIFAWLEAATGGASYNPLTILAAAVASQGGPVVYLFTAFVRIPAQVINVPGRDVRRQLAILSSGFGLQSYPFVKHKTAYTNLIDHIYG
jgi:hypothetical protein